MIVSLVLVWNDTLSCLPDFKAPSRAAAGAARPGDVPGWVGDGHDRVTVSRGLAEDVVEQRENLRQRMGFAMVVQCIVGQRDRGVDGVGLHTRGG